MCQTFKHFRTFHWALDLLKFESKFLSLGNFRTHCNLIILLSVDNDIYSHIPYTRHKISGVCQIDRCFQTLVHVLIGWLKYFEHVDENSLYLSKALFKKYFGQPHWWNKSVAWWDACDFYGYWFTTWNWGKMPDSPLKAQLTCTNQS